jgi:para-nitrobenzyl esterase
MKTVIALSIVVATIAAWAADSGPVVKVTGGQVRGAMLNTGGAVFKGIPYAQPPVGDLRWREPRPVTPWTGVRDATEFGPICPQTTQGPIPNATQISREDCLHLNVWTPEWPSTSRKPVMVWINGGGNFFGGTLQEQIDGQSLAHRGVVVVSLDCRLGSFGFFAHPALTRESPHHASGNQGLLDQIAGLEWVRDNVARFGGDESNVTVFGNSAGSVDASVLMTSRLSRGLFRRVIGESGSVTTVNNPLTLQQAEARGERLSAGWKMPAGASLKDLRAVSAADILGSDSSYWEQQSFRGPITFPNLGIVVDGYVVRRPPVEVFAAGNAHHVALLHGNTARDNFGAPKDLQKAIAEEYGPLAQRAQKLYVGGTDPLYGTPAEQWATDGWFRCSAVAQLTWHAAAGNPAFEYEFVRVPPGREAGTTHGVEITHVFGTLDRPMNIPGFPLQGATAVDRQVSDVMQQYWTNFAKTGDPNGGQLPMWPTFDVSSRAYIQFTDAGPVAKKGLRRPFCDLYIENATRLMAKQLGIEPLFAKSADRHALSMPFCRGTAIHPPVLE